MIILYLIILIGLIILLDYFGNKSIQAFKDLKEAYKDLKKSEQELKEFLK